MRKIIILACAALIAAGSSSLLAQNLTSGLRGTTPLDQEGPAPRMTPLRNTSERAELKFSRAMPTRVD